MAAMALIAWVQGELCIAKNGPVLAVDDAARQQRREAEAGDAEQVGHVLIAAQALVAPLQEARQPVAGEGENEKRPGRATAAD